MERSWTSPDTVQKRPTSCAAGVDPDIFAMSAAGVMSPGGREYDVSRNILVPVGTYQTVA
jgi:hypothetical protein